LKKVTIQIFRDYGLTIAAAVLIAVLLRYFVIEAYRIPSNAMKPTLLAGDMIFVEKWRYQFKKDSVPERGDVVVYSANGAGRNNPLFIKRVIGLPGDEVEVQGGRVLLNRLPLSPSIRPVTTSNPYLGVEKLPGGREHSFLIEIPVIENFGPERVPADAVFIIGDARTQLDMKARRSWGMVPLSSIKGRALATWLSLQPDDEPPSTTRTFPTLRFERMFRRIQ
jgi:signal peptidase I